MKNYALHSIAAMATAIRAAEVLWLESHRLVPTFP